eukprot:m.138102 g.138102  ORF g.138102 m.138102 type:complete len:218 (-) comp15908_c5_seq1:2232-2885(-)
MAAANQKNFSHVHCANAQAMCRVYSCSQNLLLPSRRMIGNVSNAKSVSNVARLTMRETSYSVMSVIEASIRIALGCNLYREAVGSAHAVQNVTDARSDQIMLQLINGIMSMNDMTGNAISSRHFVTIVTDNGWPANFAPFAWNYLVTTKIPYSVHFVNAVFIELVRSCHLKKRQSCVNRAIDLFVVYVPASSQIFVMLIIASTNDLRVHSFSNHGVY